MAKRARAEGTKNEVRLAPAEPAVGGGAPGAVYYVVTVHGDGDMPAFDPTIDDPHQRIAGYWPLGVGNGQRAAEIQAFLAQGTRVYIVGRHAAGTIARVLRLSPTPALPSAVHEAMHGRQFVRCGAPVAPTLQWPGVDGAVWAVAYNRDGENRRSYRFMTTDVQDGDWVGCGLVGDPGGAQVRGPFVVQNMQAPPDA